jgi:hypothetical protein
MTANKLVLAFFGVVYWVWAAACWGAICSYMPSQQQKEVNAWLRMQTRYRLATIEDCDCMEGVSLLRKGDGAAWKPQPYYQPYYTTGDFDGDGTKDFAVIVRPINREDGAKVLVFLKRKRDKSANPLVYPLPDKTIKNTGLFLARSKGKVSKLLVGAFGSEAEEVPIPKSGR